jgi:hypothetical protein
MSASKQYAPKERRWTKDQWKMLTVDSGIAPEMIELAELEPISRWDMFKHVGWNPGSGAIRFPYGDGCARYRLNQPYVDKQGRVAKYLMAKGMQPSLFAGGTPAAVLRNPNVPLIITESEKGVLKALQEIIVFSDEAGEPSTLAAVIGFGGVWGWLYHRQPIAAWGRVELQNRLVVIIFDSDVAYKPQVQLALRRIAVYLRSQGAIPYAIYLPDDGVNKIGLDNALVKYGIGWLLDQPCVPIPLPEPEPKARPNTKIEQGQWDMATLFWREIGQEGVPQLDKVVASHLDKNRRVPGTKLVRNGQNIRVEVQGRPFKGSHPWPLPVALYNLGVYRRMLMQEIPRDKLPQLDWFYRIISPRGLPTGYDDAPMYLAVWQMFMSIRLAGNCGNVQVATPEYFAPILRWDVARARRARDTITDEQDDILEQVERVDKKAGRKYKAYRAGDALLKWNGGAFRAWNTDLAQVAQGRDTNPAPDKGEEETLQTRQNERANDNLANLCPCGCLQTLGLTGKGKPQKWASDACRRRFSRQTLHGGKNERANEGLHVNDPKKEDQPPWEE